MIYLLCFFCGLALGCFFCVHYYRSEIERLKRNFDAKILNQRQKIMEDLAKHLPLSDLVTIPTQPERQSNEGDAQRSSKG